MQDHEQANKRLAQDVRAAIEFEDDPHKAAIEDNPPEVKVGVQAWLAVFV